MTHPLVAPELLTALPVPWRLADPVRRSKAAKELAPDPEQRTTALSALEVCLAYMMDVKVRNGDEPDWGLPSTFEDYWFMLYTTLRESLPTLADVTSEKVRGWVEEFVDPEKIFGTTWSTPPDEVVDNVGRSWAFFIVNGATEALIRWLRDRARDHLDTAERARVVHLLKEATPRLPWRLTIVSISAIMYLGGPGEREYFDRLANDPGLHDKTRDEAHSVRNRIDRQNAPT